MGAFTRKPTVFTSPSNLAGLELNHVSLAPGIYVNVYSTSDPTRCFFHWVSWSLDLHRFNLIINQWFKRNFHLNLEPPLIFYFFFFNILSASSVSSFCDNSMSVHCNFFLGFPSPDCGESRVPSDKKPSNCGIYLVHFCFCKNRILQISFCFDLSPVISNNF